MTAPSDTKSQKEAQQGGQADWLMLRVKMVNFLFLLFG
jgi:hypothetical protein